MLDTVITNGRVVTPQGVGSWDIGIEGERIAAVGLPGSLPREGARVIDATGLIVVPGGIDPHTHLAHAIMSHPDQPSITLGPEDDTRGMAFGGTTTHIDFCYVRPGHDDPAGARAAGQRAGRATRTSTTPSTSRCAGALRPRRSSTRSPTRSSAGLPELQGVHHQHPAAASQAAQATGSTSAASASPWRRSRRHGGLMVVHGEDDDVVQFNYERFRAEGRHGRHQHAPRPHQALRAAGVPAHDRAGPGTPGAAVYFVHTSAREGVDAIGEARAARPARLRRDAAPVRAASTPSTTRRRAASARTPIRR